MQFDPQRLSFVSVFAFFLVTIVYVIIFKLKKKTHSTQNVSMLLTTKKKALTKQVRFQSPFKTVKRVTLSNGKQ